MTLQVVSLCLGVPASVRSFLITKNVLDGFDKPESDVYRNTGPILRKRE